MLFETDKSMIKEIYIINKFEDSSDNNEFFKQALLLFINYMWCFNVIDDKK